MENIYNYLKLSDNLFSSGMPTPEQIPSIADKRRAGCDQPCHIQIRRLDTQ